MSENLTNIERPNHHYHVARNEKTGYIQYLFPFSHIVPISSTCITSQTCHKVLRYGVFVECLLAFGVHGECSLAFGVHGKCSLAFRVHGVCSFSFGVLGECSLAFGVLGKCSLAFRVHGVCSFSCSLSVHLYTRYSANAVLRTTCLANAGYGKLVEAIEGGRRLTKSGSFRIGELYNIAFNSLNACLASPDHTTFVRCHFFVKFVKGDAMVA